MGRTDAHRSSARCAAVGLLAQVFDALRRTLRPSADALS
jgi:hypothetical protein